MKTLSADLQALVRSGVTTLARLVDVVTTSGLAFYMTDHDRDITYGGNVYRSDYGCEPSQVRTVLGTNAESCSVDVLLTSEGINATLIEAGALDDATLRVLVVDYTNPTTAVNFFQGFVNTCDYKDRLTATISSNPLLAKGKPLASAKYSTNCRADLGDDACRVDIEPMKATGRTIVSYTNGQRVKISDTSLVAGGTWNNGLLVFTSGPNDGFSFEINTAAVDGTVILKGVLPYTPNIGDTVTLYPGCDKCITGGCTLYNNLLNFQGEPFTIAPYVGTKASS